MELELSSTSSERRKHPNFECFSREISITSRLCSIVEQSRTHEAPPATRRCLHSSTKSPRGSSIDVGASLRDRQSTELEMQSVLQASNRFSTALRLAALTAAAALFASVVAAADVGRVVTLLGAIGFAGMAIVFLPQPIALLVEALGWKLAVRGLGHRVGLVRLLRVRIATEALSLSLPAGVLLGESAKALLLRRHCGLSVNDGVTAIVARKYLLLVS